ncbi:hypothetical protein CEP54_003066 [Fusarium duplospermum]|uniref:Uncharacterized protein n=1 Tax=Fusarium duplospermum TaxID=1325734 RepID=A0A428QR62_9HYPO|nr:hypothetical protein CEP54_003066 [Fusarium duplospermum]
MTSNGTKEVLSKVIEYWGFSCPDGGHFYICENIGEQFMGCCTSDPCAKGKGVCPDKDLRAATFDGDSHTDIPSQDCGWKSAADYLYACSYEDSYFLGCCEQNACVSGCPRASLIPMSLSEDFVSRYSLKYPETSSDIPNTTTISIPRPTLTSALVSPKREGSDQNQAKYSMRAEAVAGICVAAVVVVLLLFGAFWRYSHSKGCRRTVSSPQQSSQPTYAPVLHDSSARDTEERPKQAAEVSSIAEIHAERRLPPGRLHALALALVSVHLDEKPLSDFGERVVELTRLSPTIYPILFAAVSSRFYKALARWCLERPNGIGLATLEQIFGSQSFAAAVERVFFVRTQVTIGSGILLLWAMSPLGGQSASRLLAPGNSTTTSNIVVYFSDPGSQFFAFPTWGSFDDKKSIITPLYSSTLMSSQQQKGSPRDLWELPKVPQWSPERQMDEWYDIKDDAFSRGDSHYTSLLGIKIQGLDSSSADQQYDFTVKSSYMDFKCIHAEKLDITPGFTGPFSIEMKAPWGNTLSPEAWARFKSRDDLPPIQLTYTGLGEKPQSSGWSVPFCVMINCTMQTIAVETAIRCGPRPLATSCFARRQRRVKGSHGPNRPPEPILSNPLVLQQVMDYWPWAPGEGNVDEFASPTEIYILGNPHPFTRHPYRAWTEEDLSISPDVFSRYFTTAFNTYWDAALDPYSHTNVSFTSAPAFNIISLEMGQITQPFMNSTSGTRTAVHRVYKANRLWVAILLATTTLLQLLALIGLVLQFFIRGPDVLGFASSLTRDNPYVPLAPGGSSLDGPDRARKLRDLRLQLADVRPESETGYIAVRAVPSVQDEDEQGSKAEWRPLDRKRLYV